MFTKNFIFCLVLSAVVITSCNLKGDSNKPEAEHQQNTDEFRYYTESFADLKILRYKVPGFEELSLKEKKMLYYLYEAALAGRDMIWDQNFKHNLAVRRTLEAIVKNYTGDKTTEDFEKFMTYTKRVWFSNGIHHHYSTMKIQPQFDETYFKTLLKNIPAEELPLQEGESKETLITKLTPVIFDPDVASKKVVQDPKTDMILASATNFYGENVSRKDVEQFYASIADTSDKTPVSYGLNSKLVKVDGEVKEKVWKVGGMYSPAIEKVVYWLKKASSVAENDKQKKALDLLIEYYKTGDLELFDQYNIAWVNDTASRIDVINGFIEVYGDPMGYKGSYESVVSIKDIEATKRINAISKEAQWFEDNSPLIEKHKKDKVKGISAKVITAVMESGDASPSTPIGINLPNSQWIRKDHGSKSVNIGNIVYAYEEASKQQPGALKEFAYSEEEVNRAKTYGSLADNLHTDMHEVIGHASGQLEPGVETPKETIKNYASTLEEARADLVALYYLMDPKLIEIGVMDTLAVGKAAYDAYIRNGMVTQLTRLELGEHLEEAHMRNRQIVAKWAYEKGKKDNVIEKVKKDGKTYFVVNDYDKLRVLFGDLLREIQRIKSTGDYQAAHDLVENYGVKVDTELHEEVLARYKKLNVSPYGGFINPKLIALEENGEIVDVKIEYPEDFTQQMLYYGENHSFLPTYN